jgi:hypothetical protein
LADTLGLDYIETYGNPRVQRLRIPPLHTCHNQIFSFLFFAAGNHLTSAGLPNKITNIQLSAIYEIFFQMQYRYLPPELRVFAASKLLLNAAFTRKENCRHMATAHEAVNFFLPRSKLFILDDDFSWIEGTMAVRKPRGRLHCRLKNLK